VKKKILLLILISINIFASNDAYNCKTQWIQENGKRYLPPESLKRIKIELITNWNTKVMDNSDAVKLITKSMISYYQYDSFFDINGNIGISYKADNGNLLDIHKSGDILIFKNNIPLLKAHCPKLKLKIGKLK
jgi:hypothetical protein